MRIILIVGIIIILAIFSGCTEQELISSNPSDQQSNQYPQNQQKPSLSLTINSVFYEWKRDTNDLPTCTATVGYILYNYGNGSAENIYLSTSEGEYLETVYYLGPSDSWNNDYLFSLTLNDRDDIFFKIYEREIRIEANSNFCYAEDFCLLQSSFDETYLITPNDPIVLSTLNDILSEKEWWDIRSDWEVIREWVGDQISYIWDAEYVENPRGCPVGDNHLGSDYWQFPRETLQKRGGDCEDQAILLVSLLRAYGYTTEEIYAVYGQVENEGHVWVCFKLFDLDFWEQWVYLEPTTDGILSGFGDILEHGLNELFKLFGYSHYEEAFKFNDGGIYYS